MHPNEQEANAESAANETCCHHWILDSTDKAIARGICRVCGEERRFENGFSRSRPRKKQVSKPEPSEDDSVDREPESDALASDLRSDGLL